MKCPTSRKLGHASKVAISEPGEAREPGPVGCFKVLRRLIDRKRRLISDPAAMTRNLDLAAGPCACLLDRWMLGEEARTRCVQLIS